MLFFPQVFCWILNNLLKLSLMLILDGGGFTVSQGKTQGSFELSERFNFLKFRNTVLPQINSVFQAMKYPHLFCLLSERGYEAFSTPLPWQQLNENLSIGTGFWKAVLVWFRHLFNSVFYSLSYCMLLKRSFRQNVKWRDLSLKSYSFNFALNSLNSIVRLNPHHKSISPQIPTWLLS